MNFGGAQSGAGMSAMDMQMMAVLEQKQIRAAADTFTRLTDRCFIDCVHDFTSTALTGKEETCVSRCTDKFFAYSTRAGLRFQEAQQRMGEQQQQEQQNASQ